MAGNAVLGSDAPLSNIASSPMHSVVSDPGWLLLPGPVKEIANHLS